MLQSWRANNAVHPCHHLIPKEEIVPTRRMIRRTKRRKIRRKAKRRNLNPEADPGKAQTLKRMDLPSSPKLEVSRNLICKPCFSLMPMTANTPRLTLTLLVLPCPWRKTQLLRISDQPPVPKRDAILNLIRLAMFQANLHTKMKMVLLLYHSQKPNKGK